MEVQTEKQFHEEQAREGRRRRQTSGGPSLESARERGQGRTGDAWASGSEEGRGKLRKSTGIRKREVIRGSPNGGTRAAECRAPALEPGRTQGTETS